MAPHRRARIPRPRTWAVSIQLHEPRWLWREESLEQKWNPRRSVRAGPDVRKGVAQLVEAAIAKQQLQKDQRGEARRALAQTRPAPLLGHAQPSVLEGEAQAAPVEVQEQVAAIAGQHRGG